MRLRILGAGRVGCSLAALLGDAGVVIADWWTRSPERAEAAGRSVGLTCRSGPLDSGVDASPLDATIIAVRDDAVAAVVWSGGAVVAEAPVLLHCGGALPSGEALFGAPPGVACGTLHPLLAVSTDLDAARRDLPRATFGVEGEPAATAVANEIVRRIGARPLALEAEAMVCYHAAAVVASNLAVALWGEAAALLASAGVADGERALMPLVRSTLDNVARQGAAAALTGPVRRGDVSTVERHLAALAEARPELLPLYIAGSRAALALVRTRADGPAEADAVALERLLDSP